MKHYQVQVFGVVQGVFFRAETCEQAQRLGLKGFVRNESDGSVLIEVEGNEAALNELMKWCETGPSGARVDELKIHEGEIVNFDDFKVEY